MKRREFVRASLGTYALGITGLMSPAELFGDLAIQNPRKLNLYLTNLDVVMNNIAYNPEGGKYLARLFPMPPKKQVLTLIKNGMRTLHQIGSFSKLPFEMQIHPDVQERIQLASTEMHETFGEIRNFMETLDKNEREEIRLQLKAKPQLEDEVMEALKKEAVNSGVPAERIKELENMGPLFFRRLKFSTDEIIEDFSKRLTKVTNSIHPDDPEFILREQMGRTTFERKKMEVTRALYRWHNAELRKVPLGFRQFRKQGDYLMYRLERSKTISLNLLGFGALVTALGWVLIGIGEAGVAGLQYIGALPGLCLGPAMMVTGLIILILVSIRIKSLMNKEQEIL